MTVRTMEGFEECPQCHSRHLPVSGVCIYKLERGAAYVLDACGAVLSLDMIGRVLSGLSVREEYRYVSAPAQRQAYLLTGASLQRRVGRGEYAQDGAEWITRTEYPPDVLLIESGGPYGLIKSLEVSTD